MITNNSPTITESELLAEYEKLDRLRIKTHERLLTDEQFSLVSYARRGDHPVTWIKLTQYFESRGWGKIKLPTLKAQYKKERERREQRL